MPVSRFERTVTVTGGKGRYTADVDPAWNGPVAPNGGVLAATMLRAARAELGEAAPPARSVTAHFLDAPSAGEVALDVEVLRRGHRVCFVSVQLRQADRLMVTGTVVCSAHRPDPLTMPLPRAELPPLRAAGARDPAMPAGFPPVFEQLEIQSETVLPFAGAAEARSGGWVALRDDPAPLDAARLVALCDLWWPAVFARTQGPAGVPTLALTVDLRRTAPLDTRYAYARFVTRGLAEGHLDEVGELYAPDGELLAESRQLALLVPLRAG
jgi:acyl-coenzyme A thioesterase PaaI-like protein